MSPTVSQHAIQTETFSLLHLPPMLLQDPCGADAECLFQLVVATGFLPSMPSA